MVPGQSELDRQIAEGVGGQRSGVGGQDGEQGDHCTHQEGGLLGNQSLHQEEPLLYSGSITGGQLTKTFWRQSALWVIPQQEYVVYLKISLAETVG